MAGRQRTFELIPTSLVKSNGPKPPMTSKAAKKAHQLATRGPKVSRAEQRRREAEELARQKKEYEKEKASAKAKAAREKKAAKEQAERDLRKKNGIPEPSRFVRASQPTISRFVKNGNKRTWLEMDMLAEESDTTPVADEEADQTVDPVAEPQAKRDKSGDESEDEYGGFPSFSQSEFGVVLEEVDNSAQSENVQNDRGLTTTLEPLDSKSKEPLKIAAAKRSSDEFLFEDSDKLDDMAATQLLSEAADAATRLCRQGQHSMLNTRPDSAPPKSATMSKPLPMSRNQFKSLSPKAVETSRQALQERSVNMPPPPLPVIHIKERRLISFAPPPPKPRTLPRLPSQRISNLPNLPPSATQVFLEDHLNDFFPSPSQEIRELLDDIDELPTNTQIAQELEQNLPPNALQEDYFADLICTQDFVLSSQDILEITTPCPPASKPNKDEQSTSTPTPLPTKLDTRQPRRRFFEEKDEDLLHAAIQESMMLATNKDQRRQEKNPSQRMNERKMAAASKESRGQERELSGRTKRFFNRTLSNATDYGEDEFHDCEEELLALF